MNKKSVEQNNYGAVGALHSENNKDQSLKDNPQSNWLKKMKKSLISYRLQIIGSIFAVLSAIMGSSSNAIVQVFKLDFSEATLVRGGV